MELEIKVSALPQEELLPTAVLRLAETSLGLLSQPQELLLEAHYHDDSEGLLRSRSWSLRARREGTSLVATAKGPAQLREGVPARLEINEAIETLPSPGEPLPRALSAALGEAGLRINCWPGAQWTTEVKRTYVDLRLPEGGSAELAIDHGRVHCVNGSHPIRELELELRTGRPRELLSAARQLSEHLLVRPGGRTKAARGLQLMGRLKHPKEPGSGDLQASWRYFSKLEEWLREGHQDLSANYLEAARKLLRELGMKEPQHLSDGTTPLQQAVDSAEHARLLWRIFSAIHESADDR